MYDPDGYWVEIIERVPNPDAPKYTFAQTMLRVKVSFPPTTPDLKGIKRLNLANTSYLL